LNEKGKTLVIYVDEEDEYPCVVLKGNTITIGFDIFNEVGHILAGYLERFWESSENKQLAKIPVVDYYEKILFGCLMLASKKSNIQLNYNPFWPKGKKFAVCLTHDVDRVKKTFQYLTHTIKHVKKGEIGLMLAQLSFLLRRESPYWNFDRIMEIERKLGVKSTFFFLNERKKIFCSPSEWKLYWGRYDIKDAKIVETIKRLDAEGWEIGIHGSYNSYNDLKLLEKEKKIIEKIVGKTVYGISQHYCNLDVPETWEYHEKLGLAYDSTTGFITDIGFRRGTCHPFHPFNQANGKSLSLWELPIAIMDNACVYKNWKEITDVINIVAKYKGVLLLRWHQEIFNEHVFPGRANIYEKIIETCKEKDAWITNAYNIVEWLTLRGENKLHYGEEFI
jgi:peptidoglycan/xylan/chitin deacetylase (PgdA/CDA1 family)